MTDQSPEAMRVRLADIKAYYDETGSDEIVDALIADLTTLLDLIEKIRKQRDYALGLAERWELDSHKKEAERDAALARVKELERVHCSQCCLAYSLIPCDDPEYCR